MGCTVTTSVVGHLLHATAWTIVVVLKHKRCVSLAGTVAHSSSTRLYLRAEYFTTLRETQDNHYAIRDALFSAPLEKYLFETYLCLLVAPHGCLLERFVCRLLLSIGGTPTRPTSLKSGITCPYRGRASV